MSLLTLDSFDFDLPEQLIALRPARPRSSSRLLVAAADQMRDTTVASLADELRPGDLLVFNDTRVIPARLQGTRTRASEDGSGVSKVEITLTEPAANGRWVALARPAKRLRPGDDIEFAAGLAARVEARDGAEVTLIFSIAGEDFAAALETAGRVPLPPYIETRRAADATDRRDYQAVFARHDGAVAAPTASLHFDEDVLDALAARGVEQCFVTLHVGAGTFLPVTTEKIEDHKMHAEWGEVSQQSARTIAKAKSEGRRVIPVGTTALRVIETASQGGTIAAWRGKTDIFITPGYRFNVTSGLMTNFHLPRSTLMMLVSALMGTGRIRDIYAHAIAENYRFFSYGDASLLLPEA